MLVGEFESKVTDKNRIAIPSKFRGELGAELVLSRGYEGCLILLDKKRWKDLLQTINIQPILNLSVRDTRRFILGGAHEIDIDNQGRFVLPQGLKEYSDIKSSVKFIGIEDWIEIWDENRWKIKLSYLGKSASDIAQKLLDSQNAKQ